MAVQVQGDVVALLDFTDQLKGGMRGEDAGHVLDGDGVNAGLQQLFGEVEPGLQGVGRAGGIAEGALGVGAVAADRLQGGLHVARVVHGIKDAEDVHAVFDGALHEALHHVVGVVAVAEQVLPRSSICSGVFGIAFSARAGGPTGPRRESGCRRQRWRRPQHSSER